MRRLAWSQPRFRCARALALLAGMLVAVTAFTVLTAASRTSQLRIIGTVTATGAVLAGVLVTVAAALLSAQLLRRLPTAQLLAEE